SHPCPPPVATPRHHHPAASPAQQTAAHHSRQSDRAPPRDKSDTPPAFQIGHQERLARLKPSFRPASSTVGNTTCACVRQGIKLHRNRPARTSFFLVDRATQL